MLNDPYIEEDGGVAPTAPAPLQDTQPGRAKAEKLWSWVSLMNDQSSASIQQLQYDSSGAFMRAVELAKQHEAGVVENSGMRIMCCD